MRLVQTNQGVPLETRSVSARSSTFYLRHKHLRKADKDGQKSDGCDLIGAVAQGSQLVAAADRGQFGALAAPTCYRDNGNTHALVSQASG